MIHVADRDTDLQPELQLRPRKTRQQILIVDDQVDQAEALAQCLERQGFRAAVCASGASAMQRIADKAPDLVVLDIELPDADGLELCQQLSDQPATCLLPVIIMSGRGGGEILRRSRAAGSRFFVRKPCDPSTLLLLIRAALADTI